jgi:hypothetical protein
MLSKKLIKLKVQDQNLIHFNFVSERVCVMWCSGANIASVKTVKNRIHSLSWKRRIKCDVFSARLPQVEVCFYV